MRFISSQHLLIWILAPLMGILASCGLDKKFDEIGDMKFSLVVTADNTAPEDATGTAAPQSILAYLLDVRWTDAETGETTSLWDKDPEEFLILNRERILLEKNIKDLRDKTFTDLTVEIDPILSARGKYEIIFLELDPIPEDANTTSLVLNEPLEIKKGRSYTVKLICQWHRTRFTDDETQTDEFSNPHFELKLGK